MKTIATLLTALVLQACDMTEVPEEHRATADALSWAARFPGWELVNG